MDYFNSGTTNTGGIKDHRYNNKARKGASIQELLQQGTLLPCDLLLFGITALPGIRNLGINHYGDDQEQHLIKLHIGYTDLNPGLWHHANQTHLSCEWHKEGEIKLIKTLDTCFRIHNRVNTHDNTDVTKRDTARFYNQSPFETRITLTPEDQANETWSQLNQHHETNSAECLPKRDRQINGLNTAIKICRASHKRSHGESRAEETKTKRQLNLTTERIANGDLVCGKRFEGFLLDSVLASLAPSETEKNNRNSRKGPIEPSDPDFADFRSIFGDITDDSTQFLPPAEKNTFSGPNCGGTKLFRHEHPQATAGPRETQISPEYHGVSDILSRACRHQLPKKRTR